MLNFKTTSPEETLKFGQCLAELLMPGQVICLAGDLGAGKTLLTQGIVRGLGIQEAVTSPTFTIMQIYEAPIPIYHFDLYRLNHAEELYDIGFHEYVSGQGISIIEWPDKFIDQLPETFIWIDIRCGELDNERILFVHAKGRDGLKVCEELRKCPFLL